MYSICVQCKHFIIIAKKSTSIQHISSVNMSKTNKNFYFHFKQIWNLHWTYTQCSSKKQICRKKNATKSKSCVNSVYTRRMLKFFVSYAISFMIEFEKCSVCTECTMTTNLLSISFTFLSFLFLIDCKFNICSVWTQKEIRTKFFRFVDCCVWRCYHTQYILSVKKSNFFYQFHSISYLNIQSVYIQCRIEHKKIYHQYFKNRLNLNVHSANTQYISSLK